jgi:biotin carboxyl carrier protein
MKYYAIVEGHTYEISIDHPDRITVDGIAIAADMRRVAGSRLYSLLLDNASFEVVIDQEADPRRSVYGVMVAGLRYLVKVQDERSRRLSLADRTLRAPDGELAIKAPIPGLVVRVHVVTGQVVAEGETMLILEAMKMENEVRAPRAGMVHDLRVDAGAQVAMGQVLLMLK